MNPNPRRRLGLKILGGILGVASLLAGTAAIWIGIVAERRAARMEKDIVALREEFEQRNPPRRPLRDEPLDGNAWTDYDQAFASIPRADRATINQVHSGKKVLFPHQHVELLESTDAAVDLFRRGTKRSRGAYPYVWEDGVTGKSPSLFNSQTMANLAALRSRRLLEQGRAREAADLMLDTCRLGQDLATRAGLLFHCIGEAIYHISFLELLTIVKSKDLDRENFLEVDRELEQLEKDWPDVGDAAPIEALTIGYELLKPSGNRDADARATLAESWRFGFSHRIAEADAFDELRALARKLAGISRRPWSEARRIAIKLEEGVLESRSAVVHRCFQWRARDIEIDRELRTQLQILRAAARFRATGEAPSLDDPYGDKLRTALKDDRLKIWSVGPDGVDDGGSGEWSRKEGKDIVLEVRR